MPQVRPGGAMETLPAPKDDREAKSKRQPLPSVKLQGWNHREQHDRHRENDGNDQISLARIFAAWSSGGAAGVGTLAP